MQAESLLHNEEQVTAPPKLALFVAKETGLALKTIEQ
jgi:hypothetical protein